MKRILQLLFVSSLTFFPARSIAQFHTIVKDNDTKATKEKTNNVPKKRLDEEDYFFNYQDSVAKKEKESFAKEVKENTAQGGLSVAGRCRCLTKELDMIAC